MSNDVPLEPRKRPTQERSKLLVSSVTEACKKIIETEGPDKLTAVHLAEVAGVVVGSLYQYFPNLESIVSEIFIEKMSEEYNEVQQKFSIKKEQVSLETLLRHFLTMGAAYHRRMLNFHADFYRKYHENYSWQKLDEIEKHVFELLRFHEKTRGIDFLEMKAFLLTEAISNLHQRTIHEHPEFFEEEAYIDSLLKMSMGLINPKQ